MGEGKTHQKRQSGADSLRERKVLEQGFVTCVLYGLSRVLWQLRLTSTSCHRVPSPLRFLTITDVSRHGQLSL